MPCTGVLFCQGWWRDCSEAPRNLRTEPRHTDSSCEALLQPVGEEVLEGGGVRAAAPEEAGEAEAAAALDEAGPLPERPRAKTVDIQQIQKDVPRTFFDQPEVLEVSGVIEEVLQQYAAADAEVGYCQGMSFVAAVTASQFRSADAAFEHFCAIVSRIRGLWLPGLPLLLSGVTAFEVLCRSCFADLQPCILAQDVSFDMFLPDAWLTLFSRWLPFAALWATFEFVKAEGFPGVLAITVSLLKAHKSALLDALTFKDMFVVLKELAKQPHQPDVNQLLVSAGELLPDAHAALREVTTGPLMVMRRTTSTLTRCGPCILHAKSGVELLDLHWPLLSGALQAVAEKAVGKDHGLGLGLFRPRSEGPPGSAPGAGPSRSGSCLRLPRGGRVPCLCAGSPPREDA